ncbi:hypothetical protein [Staphylothermus hellenicus]|uniref:Uncharacterized protein n=1 Tax=Staphylothermus hellenicus (strain DSM 12710 / JCM 10830 / BK20S6-10-b1 / P8) TaxID=591019 RepID=D7D8G9_STAHD|nr:hypothetical protein [Staphylothermus hellenicus]ADI32065.1 hypothetical protein Shell_0959 [Staphylothermus hellenicus DSM 12710]
MSELLELAKRMIKAFKTFECYVFEKKEIGKVRELLVKAGIRSLVRIRKADPRYPYIYVVVPWSREFEKICVAKVKELLAEGRIDRESYNKRYNELIAQCIRHHERERVKEIIEKLEKYIGKGSGGGFGGKTTIFSSEFP